MIEIVERLRARAALETQCGNRTTNPRNVAVLLDGAAAAIETLTAENKRMREDLGCLAALLPSGAGTRSRPDSDVIAFYITLRELRAARELARAALGDAS